MVDWEERWQRRDTPWDLGRAPEILTRELEAWDGPAATVLVPGAGAGHDALAFAAAGHRVSAVDVAPTAVEVCRRAAAQAGLPMEVRVADLLALPSSFDGAYDLVWEHTCYCTLPPERRDEYVHAVADVLKPRRRLFGLFWNHGKPDGPPYDTDPDEVARRFAERFVITSREALPERDEGRNGEWLFKMRRRD